MLETPWLVYTIIFIVAGSLIIAVRSLVGYLSRTRQTIHELKRSEADARYFQEQLKTLHEVSLILETIDNFDDLCRKAVELGRSRLGFERLGLWFVDNSASEMMVGSFGIDETGQIRDERDVRIRYREYGVYREMIRDQASLHVQENVPLYNHKSEVVGTGWLGTASLWDGRRVIGWISADYFVSKVPPSGHQGELLKLFGLTLGHLCSQKRLLSALQQRKSYLKEAEAIAHLGNFVYDLRTQHVECSDEVYRILGHDPGTAFTLAGYWRLLHPKDVRRVVEAANTIVINKQMYSMEHEVTLLNGTRKYLSVTARPVLDDKGEVSRIFGIIHDITQAKQTELNIIASEKRLRAVVSALPDRAVVLDSDGYYHDILKANPDPIANALGKNIESGHRVHDVFSKETAELFIAKVRETIATNQVVMVEYSFQQDGKTFILEGRIAPFADPVSGEARVVWLSRDITERRQTEEALSASENLLRTVISALPDRTMIFDAEGRYQEILQPTYRLPSGKAGIVEVELGRPIRDFMPAEFADFCERMIRTTIESNKMQIVEYPSPPEIEVDMLMEASIIPFRDPRAGETRVLWITRDITERRQAERGRLELALQQQKLDFFRQFVVNMTHDLRSPLTVIETSLYLMERQPNPENRMVRSSAIREQIGLLKRMIEDILLIGRLDAIPQLEFEAVDFASLMQETLAALRPKAEYKAQQLDIDVAAQPTTIQASSAELRRVMTNLIDNAIKYTPESGRVAVRVFPQDSEIITEIRDSGIGISANDLPHIFERFYRTEGGRGTASGTGLGLAIVHRIVELHGGHIEVESQPNQGSTFRVHLPAIAAS